MGQSRCSQIEARKMNWKLMLSLSTFGLLMGLCLLTGRGVLLILLWPIVIVISVCLIVTRAPGRFALHGFLVGVIIQIWAGAMRAFYVFDSSRIGLVEVTPRGIHPQVINAFETAVLALVTGAVIASLVWLSTKTPSRGISRVG